MCLTLSASPHSRNRNRQLTVQFLHADFAAVNEVSGKNLCWVLKIDVLFMFVHTFLQIAVYRSVTQLFFPLSTESHRWETGRHPSGLCYLVCYSVTCVWDQSSWHRWAGIASTVYYCICGAAWSSGCLVMHLTNAVDLLRACVRARGGHFEHTLWLSICFPCTWWILCFTPCLMQQVMF